MAAARSSVLASRLTSAPRARAAAVLSAPREVAITVAPAALAIWMAVTPMPLVAPWISRFWPAFSPPASNTLAKTVKTVSGRTAACT